MAEIIPKNRIAEISVNRKLIEEKYLEMKQQCITVDFLDQKALGGIKVYINVEPGAELFSIQIDGDTVSVGTY